MSSINHLQHSITADQQTLLTGACERWQQIYYSSNPVSREDLALAVTNLYLEMSLEGPREYLYFRNPRSAMSAYPSWRDRTGLVAPCLWHNQLPLFDPQAYWRQSSQWPDMDLAISRTPNAYGCYVHGVALPGIGKVLHPAVHAQIWSTVLKCLRGLDWCTSIIDVLEDDDEISDLCDRFYKENSTSQATLSEYITLGPLWLFREVAAVEFARDVLGCRVNNRLLDAEIGILKHGGLLLTFERLVVCIDRPEYFENGQPVFAES